MLVKLHFPNANRLCIVPGEGYNQKILSDAVEFCEMLPTASLGKYYQGSVTCGTDTAVIFFSDAMSSVLCEVMHIQFDGTFLQYLFNLLNSGPFL